MEARQLLVAWQHANYPPEVGSVGGCMYASYRNGRPRRRPCLVGGIPLCFAQVDGSGQALAP